MPQYFPLTRWSYQKVAAWANKLETGLDKEKTQEKRSERGKTKGRMCVGPGHFTSLRILYSGFCILDSGLCLWPSQPFRPIASQPRSLTLCDSCWLCMS